MIMIVRKLILALAMCGLLATAVRADLMVVKDGKDPAPVFLPAQPQPLEETAARELARYLGQISGATFAAPRAAAAPLAERGIFIGAVDPDLAAGLAIDDYRIKVSGQRLYILGGSSRSTLYGVYALLEKLGCRWWAHDAEDVPSQNTLTLAEQDATFECDFTMYNPWNREAQSELNNFFYKARTVGCERFSGGHTLYPLLTPYATAHPDIYPMDENGKRAANDLHFCYLAPGIAEALADALAQQVEANGRNVKDVIYFAGMGDWYGGMCQCPACQKVYEAEAWTDPDGRKKPAYTATLLRMINKTAAILEKKYPGIRVGTFAYMSLEAPPANTVPRGNVIIRIPRLRHCTVHPAELCDTNRSYRRNLERWCELAPGRVYIWEYAASFGQGFLTPFPCLHSMATNIKYYHRLGVKGVEIQGNYVSYGGDLALVKNYVWRKIFWDPTLDPNDLAREFCKGYYGPAADDIYAYIDTLEQSVYQPKSICVDEFQGQSYLTPEVLARLTTLRDQALQHTAGQEPFTQRVKEATVSLDARVLWGIGPLMEQGDKLIRADFGEDTFPRAMEMLKYTRNASMKEAANYVFYHTFFQSWHGGPLVRLTAGPLEVKLAPRQAGQLRQISYNGVPLLYLEYRDEKSAMPLTGGSFIYDGTYYSILDGQPTSRRARMQGEAGILQWNSVVRRLVWNTVELADDGSINQTCSVRMAVPGTDKMSVGMQTMYPLPADHAKVKVECQLPDNTWQAVPLPEDGKEAALPSTTAIRLSFLDKGLMLTDRYLWPATSGTIAIDVKKGAIKINLGTAGVDINYEEEKPFLKRNIKVEPIK